MKILIIGGFLGSGKTSFLMQLAHYMTEEMGISKIAVLENEIGEVSVDDQLIGGAGLEVRSLFAGCVCCSMAGELPVTIEKIGKEVDPDWLIMEATGLAFPTSIKANIYNCLGLACRICCLADAKRWDRIRRAMEQLVTDQLTGADIILVNKIDLVDAGTLQNVLESIRSVNDSTEVITMSAGGEIPKEIFEKVLKEE